MYSQHLDHVHFGRDGQKIINLDSFFFPKYHRLKRLQYYIQQLLHLGYDLDELNVRRRVFVAENYLEHSKIFSYLERYDSFDIYLFVDNRIDLTNVQYFFPITF